MCIPSTLFIHAFLCALCQLINSADGEELLISFEDPSKLNSRLLCALVFRA